MALECRDEERSCAIPASCTDTTETGLLHRDKRQDDPRSSRLADASINNHTCSIKSEAVRTATVTREWRQRSCDSSVAGESADIPKRTRVKSCSVTSSGEAGRSICSTRQSVCSRKSSGSCNQTSCARTCRSIADDRTILPETG
jgi:hypothetical protein